MTWKEVRKRAEDIARGFHHALDVKLLLLTIAVTLGLFGVMSVALLQKELRPLQQLSEQLRNIDGRLGAMPLAIEAAILQAHDRRSVQSAAPLQQLSEQLRSIDGRLGAMPLAIEAAILQAQNRLDTPDESPEGAEPLVTSVVPVATTCGATTSCTGHFYVAGRCNGNDQVPILQKAWEKSDIAIDRVTLGFALAGRGPHNGVALVGNSAHVDIMALQMGPGTISVPFDPPFHFPARVDAHTHIDIHIGCSPGQRYRAWVLLYYRVLSPAAGSPAPSPG